jgi:streptogramin lyase
MKSEYGCGLATDKAKGNGVSRTRLGYPRRWWVQLALAAVALLLAFPAVGRAVTVQAFPVPSPVAHLAQIVAGPDGALWFTEQGAGNVGRITTGGQIAEYSIPNNASGLADSGPTDIVSSGGGLWFLTDIGESTYRMATSGTFTLVYSNEFYPAANLSPSDLGGVWLMQSFGDGNPEDGQALVRVDPNGTATDYPATHTNHLDSIAEAADGSVWFNDGGSYLYRMTDAGAQNSSPLSLPSPNEVSSIAFAPDGEVWFTDYAPNSLTGDGCCGGIDELAGGVPHRTPVGIQQVVEGIEPDSLAVGPDGALWFAFHKPPPFPSQMNSFDGVGRIDPATGQVQLADTDPYVPGDIAFGSDGALWFVDNGANAIGRITISASLFPSDGPGTVAGGVPSAPVVTLSLPSARIASLRRTGALRIGCHLAGAGRCSLTATITPAIAHRLGLKPAHGAKTFALAHGFAVLHRAGRATINLRFATRFLRALARARNGIPMTITAVSSAPGAKSVTVTRSLILRR